MIPEKVKNFFLSSDYDDFASQVGNFLGISWGDERMANLIAFLDDLLRTNKKGDELKESAKNFLKFLDEEKLNNFLDYLETNWRAKIDEMWQEESVNKSMPSSESQDEREKRYLEMMKIVWNVGPKKEIENKEEVKESEERKKIISLEPELKEESPSQEILVVYEGPKEEEPVLPEGTIIIKKKEEPKQKIAKGEDFLDLSNL